MSTARRNNNTSDMSDPTIKTRVKDEAGLFVTSGPVIDAPSPTRRQGYVHPGEENAEADEGNPDEDDDEDGDGEDDAEHMEAIDEKVMDVITSVGTPYDTLEEQLPDLTRLSSTFQVNRAISIQYHYRCNSSSTDGQVQGC